jgi:hypothetical protein
MKPFDYIAIALSLILGLGITQLLSSAVGAFRARHRVALDWTALAWAAVILFWQLQYWWALFDLSASIQVWTILHFVVLVVLALFLFVSGALILPSYDRDRDSELSGAFQRDGRWALSVMSAYFAACLAGNWFLFNTPPLSYVGALVTALMIMPLLFLWQRNRFIRVAIVVLNIALSLWAGSVISPAKY